MPITRFEQDTTKSFGVGNFVDDQGRSMYLNDPETAQRFVPTMPGQKATKLGSQVKDETDAITTQHFGTAQPVKTADSRLASNGPMLGQPGGDFPPSLPSGAPPSAAETGALTVSPTEERALKGPGGAAPGAPASAAHAAVARVTAPSQRAALGLPSAPAPAAAAPAPGGRLPISSVSTSTAAGRPVEAVKAQVAAEAKAGAASDAATLGMGVAKDARADAANLAEQSALQQSTDRAGKDVASAQAAQRDTTSAVGKLQAEIEANDKSLDPDRFMNSMSTGKRISMVILAALNGGFQAMAGQKGNLVLDIIDKQIDADIDKQKSEIASGRLRKGNIIAEYMRKGYKAEDAEKLARDRIEGNIGAKNTLEVKRIGASGENTEQAQLMNSQMSERRVARQGDLLAQTEAKTQTQVNREAPKAVVTDPLAAETKGIELELKKAQLAKTALEAENAKNEQLDASEGSKKIYGVNEKGEPNQTLTPEKWKDVQAVVNQVGPALAETAGAVNMTKEIVTALGGTLDVTNGQIQWPADNLKGSGPVDVHGGYTGALTKGLRNAGLYRADVDKVRDAQGALKQYVTSQLTGANSSLRQDETFGAMVGGDLSNEDRVKENVQAWSNTLFAARNQHLARLGVEGQALNRKNLASAEAGAGAAPQASLLRTHPGGAKPGVAPAAPPAAENLASR
jgi:hypothetical protein